MREYGRVHSAFWSSHDVQSLSDDAKLLALYLLSCSHGTIAGICRLPDGYISEDLDWTQQRVSKGFEELFQKGFANRCETTKWAWIRKFLHWNAPENPNQWKAVWKVVDQIPSQCSWRADFLGFLARLTGKDPPPDSNPSGTLSEPFRNLNSISTATGTQQKEELPEGPVEPERSTAGVAVRRVFSHWQAVHHHPQAKLDRKRAGKIREALKRYSETDLCTAIEGYRNSAHHMGQNDRGTVYDDIELLLRDSTHVENGLRFARMPPRPQSKLTATEELLANLDSRNGTAPPGEVIEHEP